MRAMILAAGRGERLRPLTDQTPKPLLEVAGQPLIVYSLQALAAAGIQDIVINIAYLGHLIQAVLGDGNRYGVRIQYSVETQALETGGGVYQALPLLGAEPFIVLSADIWSDYPLQQLPSKLTGLAHLVLVDNPDYHRRGDFSLLSDGQLTNEGDAKLTFANMGIYHPDLFKDCKPGFFRLGDLLHSAVTRGQVTGEHYHGGWANVGTAEQLIQLDKFLNQPGFPLSRE